MVITGKGYGSTNCIALDRAGAVLMEKTVEVRGRAPASSWSIAASSSESYSCTPNCERRITLGDSPTYFDATIGQTAHAQRAWPQAGAPQSGDPPAYVTPKRCPCVG